MEKIYVLQSDVTNFCSFIQDIGVGEESIMGIAMRRQWSSFKSEYKKITLELWRNDYNKRNYKFDFSSALNPFLVISEKCLSLMGDVLTPRGEVLPVITESKRKNFFGYYPTNVLSGCFDKNKSEYRVCLNGIMIEKIVLFKEAIKEKYLFAVEEDISRIFVTDKFKLMVERHGLEGFDFSKEVELS